MELISNRSDPIIDIVENKSKSVKQHEGPDMFDSVVPVSSPHNSQQVRSDLITKVVNVHSDVGLEQKSLKSSSISSINSEKNKPSV